MPRKYIHSAPNWQEYELGNLSLSSNDDLSNVLLARGTIERDGQTHNIEVSLNYLDGVKSEDGHINKFRDCEFTSNLDEEQSKLKLRLTEKNIELRGVFVGSGRNFQNTGMGTIAFESFIKPLAIKLNCSIYVPTQNVHNVDAEKFYNKEQLRKKDSILVWRNRPLTLEEIQIWIQDLELKGFKYDDLPSAIIIDNDENKSLVSHQPQRIF